MKTNFKYLLVASMIAVGFTSCNKDDKVGPDGGEDGGEAATLAVRFVQPTTYAGENVATNKESEVQSFSIFIYNTEARLVKDTIVNRADATQLSDKSWQVNVTTTTGQKDIYVGLNLSTELHALVKNSGIYGIHNLSKSKNAGGFYEWAVDNNFYMFSHEVTSESIASGTNPVDVTVERMAAKVNVIEKAGGFNSQDLEASAATFDNIRFAMGQVNTVIYPMQRRSGTTFLSPNYDLLAEETIVLPSAEGHDNDTIDAINKYMDYYSEFRPSKNSSDSIHYHVYLPIDEHTVTAPANFTVKYATENTVQKKYKGALTYASVIAQFTPKYIATYDANSALKVKLTDNPSSVWQEKDYYVIIATGGEYLYFDDKNEADDYVTAIQQLENRTPNVKHYKKGVCYYYVYLNNSRDYNTIRNDFYQIRVNSVQALGEPEPEVPGPGEEVEGDANLDITITIKNWNFVEQPTDLG